MLSNSSFSKDRYVKEPRRCSDGLIRASDRSGAFVTSVGLEPTNLQVLARAAMRVAIPRVVHVAYPGASPPCLEAPSSQWAAIPI